MGRRQKRETVRVRWSVFTAFVLSIGFIECPRKLERQAAPTRCQRQGVAGAFTRTPIPSDLATSTVAHGAIRTVYTSAVLAAPALRRHRKPGEASCIDQVAGRHAREVLTDRPRL